MEQRMRYMNTKDVVIIDTKQRCMVVAAEGTGDNLSEEDMERGYKDYAMLSLYSIDGDELALVDSGQMMTEKLIADMDDREYAERLADYWELNKDSIVIKL